MSNLPFNIDLASVVIMESLGAISFVVALLFFRQFQKIKDRQKAFQDALGKKLISDRTDGKCYSSEWTMDNVVYKPKKLLNATPLLMVAITFLLAVWYYVVGPRIIASIVSLGYASVIALLGLGILFRTDAFEAYSYTSAINGVAVEQLDKEDQGYLELAREALEKAFRRFVSLGVAFAVFGAFIPQIFNGVVSLLMNFL